MTLFNRDNPPFMKVNPMTTIQCIHTGCNVFLEAYGTYVRADAFSVGEHLLLRTTRETRVSYEDVVHFTLHDHRIWFNRQLDDGRYGTLLAEAGQFTNHGKKGVPV